MPSPDPLFSEMHDSSEVVVDGLRNAPRAYNTDFLIQRLAQLDDGEETGA